MFIIKKPTISSFYEDKDRLDYHPETFSHNRGGLRKLFSFDDRFLEVNKLLTKYINLIPTRPVKILDIGVGDGVYESLLDKNTRKKCKLFGIDISKSQLNRTRQYIDETKLVDVDHEKIPYPANSFDIIIISEVLEHLFFPEHVLDEAQRLLKKNGYLLLTFPNSGALQLRLSLLILGHSPLLNYYQNKAHIRFYNTKDIDNILGNNFTKVEELGLGSFLFDRWNFPTKIITPRILQFFGNKFLKGLSLGTLLLLQKK